jgi:ribosome-associated toxin RatA of RatAB toxin-antitoxin module
MASATTNATFNCTADEFFKLISDYEKYPEFLTEVKDVKILKTSGPTKEMEYSVSLIKTFKYKLKVEEKAPTEIQFHFISGDVFKTMKGSWKIKPVGNKCNVDYSVEASFGMLIPDSVAKPLVSANLPMMIENLKKRILKVYGK